MGADATMMGSYPGEEETRHYLLIGLTIDMIGEGISE